MERSKIEDLCLIDVFSGNEHSHIKLKNNDEYYVILIAYYTRNFKGLIKVDGSETLECRFFDVKDIPDNILNRHLPIINKYLEIV